MAQKLRAQTIQQGLQSFHTIAKKKWGWKSAHVGPFNHEGEWHVKLFIPHEGQLDRNQVKETLVRAFSSTGAGLTADDFRTSHSSGGSNLYTDNGKPIQLSYLSWIIGRKQS
jgi:hypothetical protein